MKKPWEQGYIPKPGKKPQYKGPATPKGWRRAGREDCIEFRRMGVDLWTFDRIIGVVGKPWKLWLNHTPATLRQPDTQMTSLTALIAWYEIERASRESEVYQLPAGSLTGRLGVSASQYQQMLGRISRVQGAEITGAVHDELTYKLPISMDFKSLEERTAAWMEQATPLLSTDGTGSPASNSTSEAPSGETACIVPPTSARTPGTEDG